MRYSRQPIQSTGFSDENHRNNTHSQLISREFINYQLKLDKYFNRFTGNYAKYMADMLNELDNLLDERDKWW